MSPEATRTLAELDALWAPLESGWQRLFSRIAVKELTLRASFDLDLLAPARIANRVASGMIPDCPNCQDVCCAGLENVVSLRLRDIATLIDAGRTEVISRKKPRFPEAMLASRPALRELVASELFRTLPVLKQTGELHVCSALSDDLRCTLHPHWPLSCERFPYSLNAFRKQVVWGSRCQSMKRAPEHAPRSSAMFGAAVQTFNERVRDAVLLAHARQEHERLGIGKYLIHPDEDPFEAPGSVPAPASSRLPIVD